MADWFRWWHGTVTDAKFGVISSKVGCSLPEVIAVWAYLLEQSSECHVRGDVTRYVSVTENVTRNDGVTEIAWALRMRNETVTDIVTELCNAGMILEGRIEAWERRQPNREDAVNSGSKTNAQRQKEYRERKKNACSNSNASVTHSNAQVTHQNRTEQSRTEVNPKPISVANATSGEIAAQLPPNGDPQVSEKAEPLTLFPVAHPMACPVEKLVSMYHELMPRNPRCKVLNQSRRKAIQARWKEAADLDTFPFKGGYDSQAKGLACWREFFAICADSDFLTGKAQATPGRPPFIADLDFLMSPSAFAKTLENKYHREVA